MANNVDLIEDEYTSLESGVSTSHDNCIDEFEKVISKIRTLNTKGGGVYIEQLTPKIDAVISELETFKSSLESVYDAHETIISSFQTLIDNYDNEL